MSRTVNIDIKCDQCQGSKTEDQIEVVPFRFGRKEVMLDLCPECKAELEDTLFQEWLTLRPSTEPVQHGCTAKGCDRVFNTQGALRIHIARIHKEAAA